MRCARTLTSPLLLVLMLQSVGCDLFGGDDDEPPAGPSSLVVANGGNFSDQNGFLTLYDAGTGTTSELGNLGAFAHGVAVRGSRAYVSLNTFSVGRVDVVDLDAGNVVQQISVPVPRSVAFISNDRMLVTNSGAWRPEGSEPGFVSTVDLNSGSAGPETTTVGLWPEGIVVHEGRAFIANSGDLGGGTTLSIVSVSTGEEERIDLGCDGPNEVFLTTSEDLVVVCEGKTEYDENFAIVAQTNGQVVLVDPASSSVSGRIQIDFQLGSANGSQSAYYDGGSGELYAISDGADRVFRFDLDQRTLDRELEVPDQDNLIGLSAVAYDGGSERLYLARLARGPEGFPDFTSSGSIIVLDRAGVVVDRFAVGPAPSHIAVRDS